MWNEVVVCMNEKYRGMVKDTNKSLYQISHETGIPYTILNELKNEKKDINNIASETVYKLCLYFGCQMEDIMNPFAILKNSMGVYFGMKYKWNSFDDGIELHIYDNDADIKRAIDFIVSDEMKAIGNAENLERLFNELINKDWFMTLPDFESYRAKKDEMLADYEDRKAWAKMMLTNISKAGFFSSDRTIEQYNKDIWKLD